MLLFCKLYECWNSLQQCESNLVIVDGKINDIEYKKKEIVEIYHTSQIAVIPSLYEGFGFGAGEAMACGTPLISTDSGGLKDVIGDSAVRIKAGCVEEIEKEIKKLFKNDAKRRELSLKGRRRMEDLFDWKISASNYVKVFEDIIKKHNSANN